MARLNVLYIYTVSLVAVAVSSAPTLRYKTNAEVNSYFEKYGYFTSLNETDGFQNTLRLFQRRFNLQQTGEIDDDTLVAMNTPRCAQIDGQRVKYRPTTRKFAVKVTKDVTMFYSRIKLIALVHRAYKMWNEISNISFYEAIGNSPADTHISFTNSDDHSEVVNATYPGGNDGFQRVILNEDAPFFVTPYYNRSRHKKGSDLLRVLVHGIGHNLGFSHSYRKDSLMYPLFPIVKEHRLIKFNDRELSLIKELYRHIWPPKKNTCTPRKKYRNKKEYQYEFSEFSRAGKPCSPVSYLISVLFFLSRIFRRNVLA